MRRRQCTFHTTPVAPAERSDRGRRFGYGFEAMRATNPKALLSRERTMPRGTLSNVNGYRRCGMAPSPVEADLRVRGEEASTGSPVAASMAGGVS